MTAAEISEATRRLRELEEKRLLPVETIRELKQHGFFPLIERQDKQTSLF